MKVSRQRYLHFTSKLNRKIEFPLENIANTKFCRKMLDFLEVQNQKTTEINFKLYHPVSQLISAFE